MLYCDLCVVVAAGVTRETWCCCVWMNNCVLLLFVHCCCCRCNPGDLVLLCLDEQLCFIVICALLLLQV